MKNRLLIIFLAFILIFSLSACTGSNGGNDGTIDNQDENDIYMSVEMKNAGEYPLDIVVEQIKFASEKELPEGLSAFNDSFELLISQEWDKYKTYEEKGYDYFKEQKLDWKSINAYPMTQGRYLNAFYLVKSNKYFIDDSGITMDAITNTIYDCEEERLILNDEALELANLTVEDINESVSDYMLNCTPLEPVRLYSFAPWIDAEGEVHVAVSMEVTMPNTAYNWYEFFSIDYGNVSWMWYGPVDLYYVDEFQDVLECQKVMAEGYMMPLITMPEAIETMTEIAEVQDLVNQGYKIVAEKETVSVNDEECWLLHLGKQQSSGYSRDYSFAVSYNTVFMYDYINDQWLPMAFG